MPEYLTLIWGLLHGIIDVNINSFDKYILTGVCAWSKQSWCPFFSISGIRSLADTCDQFLGSPVTLMDTFGNTAADPVIWIRPDGVIVGCCKLGQTCDTSTAGYVLSQTSVLNYTIIITSATDSDAGEWIFKDDTNASNFGLELLSGRYFQALYAFFRRLKNDLRKNRKVLNFVFRRVPFS